MKSEFEKVTWMSKHYSFKHLFAALVMINTLDAFVTYHSWWQRIVVIVTIGLVMRYVDVWAREDERKKMNPPQSY